MQRRGGFGMAEVLVASALLAVAVVPLITMSTQGVKRANEDRARVIAFTLASNALERFATNPSELRPLLTQTAGSDRVTDDLLTTKFAADLGGGDYGPAASAAQMIVRLRARASTVPSFSHLIAESRFKTAASGVSESIFVELPLTVATP